MENACLELILIRDFGDFGHETIVRRLRRIEESDQPLSTSGKHVPYTGIAASVAYSLMFTKKNGPRMDTDSHG